MATTSTPSTDRAGDDRGRGADRPGDIPARGWRDVALRVKDQVRDDNVLLLAAGIGFYGLLALVPALAAAVGVYGLVGSPDDLSSQLRDLSTMPEAARNLIEEQLTQVTQSSSAGLGVAAVIGVLVALWSASAAMKNVLTAVNTAYDEDESRGFVKLRGMALGLTVGAIVFLTIVVLVLTVVPGWFGEWFGDAGRWVASVLRWPVLALSFLGALAVVYRYGPDRDDPRWRWVSWGAGVAVVVWLVASGLFTVYATTFGSYNETYGSLSGVIVLMLWLWITAIAVILGAEVNAELERQTARDTTVGETRPMGTRRARAADTVAPSPGGG